MFSALAIGLDDVVVRVRRVRVLVQVLHVRVRRRAVEGEIALLYILAVVAFAIVQSEQTFIGNPVLAVPKRQRKTEETMLVGELRQAVLTPVVSTRPGLIMGEMVPRASVVTVIFAHRAPLPFAQVRP